MTDADVRDCDPLIDDPHVFPRRPVNLPALDHVAYRIGEYAEMVEAMTRHIDRQVALAAWTHRGSDDPAIALLEGAAIVGDILSFYQERYANEAFLRTASWRESIERLVRLTGYRLAPALGGRAALAVEIKGAGPVTVPLGWPVKADLEGGERPAEFQTVRELVAWPHLSRFRLHRKRLYGSSIVAGADTVEVAAVEGVATIAAARAAQLAPGDRLMILPEPPAWVQSGGNIDSEQRSPQVLEVAAVEEVLGRTILTFETGVRTTHPRPVTAYRLGRTFRHFGHAAAATFTENVTDGSGNITGAREMTTWFDRHLDEHSCANTSADRYLPGAVIPLDQDVADLAVNGGVVVETDVHYGATVRHLTVHRTIAARAGTSMQFGAQTSPVTWLTISAPLVPNASLAYGASADIRDYRVHEVTSAALELRPAASGQSGVIANGGSALWFFGTQAEVGELAGRPLTLQHDEDGRVETITNIDDRDDFTGGGSDPQMWALSFDAPPASFRREEFDEAAPTISVFGNLVDVDEGKAVGLEVIGNGDGRAVFQTFRLPKPLTYHLSSAATPPWVPALTVYVDGRVWTPVPSLFGQPPDAEVFVVREDGDGVSWVQFGDGKTGARLPSGVGNVAAQFRTGAGARGALKEGAVPSAGERIAAVRALAMPEGTYGGADREDGSNAREAAPGKVQGLGRLVSLRDYETELLAIPGVERVRADWDLVDDVPTVVLRVLLEHGRDAEFDEVRDTIYVDQRCRGPNRFALAVQQAFRRQVYVDLRFGLDPRFAPDDVEARLVAALAPMDVADADAAGLFALRARRLGGPEYATRIEGVAQGVDGVVFARVAALDMFSAAASRSSDALALPAAPRPLHAQVVPQPNELLALLRGSLTLSAVPPDVEGECS